MFAKYRKAIGQVLVTVAVFVVSAITDDVISPEEWVLLAGTAVTAVGVYVVPNLDEGIGAVAKSVVAFLLAGLTVLATLKLGDGLSTAEILTVLIAAAAAVGLTGLPNAWPPATLRVGKIPPQGTAPGVPPAGQSGYPV